MANNDGNNGTSFENRCMILSELWMEYRDQVEFTDFVEYNDLGLPLSFLLDEGIVLPTDRSTMMINETFDLFLATLGRETDEGYESLDDMLVG